jgi:hypothetical protein
MGAEARERRAVPTRKGAIFMSTNCRIGNTLAAALLAFGLVACTTQESNEGGTGGSAGMGTGGTISEGGSGGGTTAASGCPQPLPALITDFETATAPDATQVRFGGNGVLSGGGSVWGGLASEVVAGTWHISGTVTDYAGFNFYIDNCTPINASAYKGLSFTLSGGATNQGTPVTLGMSTINDTPSAAWLISKGDTQAKETDPGTCTPTSGNGRYYHPGCADPSKSIDVPTAATPVSVLWTDLTGGQPDVSPKPDQIIAMYVNLPWTGSGATPYPADLTIDNLSFIP